MMFVADAAGMARPLTFQDWDGKKFIPVKSLTAADFDPEKKTLSSHYKGRGIGDCGALGEWKWNGRSSN